MYLHPFPHVGDLIHLVLHKRGWFSIQEYLVAWKPWSNWATYKGGYFFQIAHNFFFCRLYHNDVDFEKLNAAYSRSFPMVYLVLTYSYSYLLEFVVVVETKVILHCFITSTGVTKPLTNWTPLWESRAMLFEFR